MHESDINQHDPGQARRNQQQTRGDQLGRARARRRRFRNVMIVMTMVIVTMVVMGGRRMRISAMPIVMMLDGIAARVARMRPEDGYQAGQNGAQQRQKDDCLNHSCVSPSSN